jgi:hypothetical protein
MKNYLIACVFLCMCWDWKIADVFPSSLQFDPAPRAGEPLVTRRAPDYFLVSENIFCPSRALKALPSSDETTNVYVRPNDIHPPKRVHHSFEHDIYLVFSLLSSDLIPTDLHGFHFHNLRGKNS